MAQGRQHNCYMVLVHHRMLH